MPHHPTFVIPIITTLIVAIGFISIGALLHADWKVHKTQNRKVDAAISEIERPLPKPLPNGFRHSYDY